MSHQWFMHHLLLARQIFESRVNARRRTETVDETDADENRREQKWGM